MKLFKNQIDDVEGVESEETIPILIRWLKKVFKLISTEKVFIFHIVMITIICYMSSIHWSLCVVTLVLYLYIIDRFIVKK